MSTDHAGVRTPQQERSRSTKTSLMDAGQRLFCSRGFHGTNSKEIAAEAGVAIGSFYAYFKDKKDLFIAVLDRYSQRIFASLPELPTKILVEDKAEEVLSDYIHKIVRAHDLPQLHRELFVVLRNDPDLEDMIHRWQQESVRRIEGSLQDAARFLRIRNTRAAAILMNTTIEATVQRLTLYRAEIEEKQLVEELADMFCRYLLVDGEK